MKALKNASKTAYWEKIENNENKQLIDLAAATMYTIYIIVFSVKAKYWDRVERSKKKPTEIVGWKYFHHGHVIKAQRMRLKEWIK